MRFALGSLGLLATPLYWGVVLLFCLGLMMGDCAPGHGRRCPTDSERRLYILAALIGGTALYGAAIALWRWLDDRLAPKSV